MHTLALLRDSRRRSLSRGVAVAGFTFAALCSSGGGEPVWAALRSRELVRTTEAIEPELQARAAQTAGDRVHAIVEASGSNRSALERGGADFLLSIDGDLWLASIPVSMLMTPGGVGPGVRAWDLRTVDRAGVDLARSAARDAEGRLLVRVKSFRDVDAGRVRGVFAASGAVVLRAAVRLGVWDVALPEPSISQLLEDDAIRWMEPSPPNPVEANNGVRFDAEVDGPQALGYGGAGVLLGMWDSGTPDPSHPDLAGRIIAGQGGLSTDLHSTHVAGVAIGNGANSAAYGGLPLQWRGIATGASLVVYNALDAIAEVDSAIQFHDIDLSTNSWVYPVTPGNCAQFGDYGADAPEFDAIVRGAYGKQLPVVFAAGNERDDGDCGLDTTGGYFCLPPPATAKNVISVGAHHSDVLHMTPFSSWGPTDDGRMKPDMTAPGCQQGGDSGVTSTFPGGGYIALCGTSMAAPAVSGAIAILLEEWRARYPADPLPSTSKALLGGFAKDRANPGPDYRFGLGAIRLDRSLKELRSASTIEDEVGQGEVDSWSFRVAPGTDTLTITIAWDDPPGAELADTTLVNDLDLTVETPAATIVFPFVLNPANPSANATVGTNHLDNVEQVRVVGPAAGLWTARVSGFRVPDGPQEYSLVGFDTRPPADPAAFVATTTSDSSIALTWTRPGDPDRTGTLIVRSMSTVTWSPAPGVTYPVGAEPSPGVFVISSSDADHSSTPFLDSGLDPGTTYFYGAYAFDEIPNASWGVFTSAATTSNAVAVREAPPVAPGEPRIAVTGSNPTSGGVQLRFELPRMLRFTLSIYDVRGARIAELRRGVLEPGSYQVEWNGRSAEGGSLPTGVYFARLETPLGFSVAKLLLVR